jgi:hypothetical protein
MTGSNTFLPMLDPVLDTFDSVRVRSPFCLAVVLATAARARETTNPADNVKQICHGEARRLAAETLFIGNPVLEDAQAMTILAAFSERTWFAVGHATQMAMVLRLQDALPQLLKGPRSIFTADTQRTARLLARQARTWLMILSIEWEIAAGTARPPRIQAIDAETLRAFATHPASNVSDSRIVSLLELIILRGWPPSTCYRFSRLTEPRTNAKGNRRLGKLLVGLRHDQSPLDLWSLRHVVCLLGQDV